MPHFLVVVIQFIKLHKKKTTSYDRQVAICAELQCRVWSLKDF